LTSHQSSRTILLYHQLILKLDFKSKWTKCTEVSLIINHIIYLHPEPLYASNIVMFTRPPTQVQQPSRMWWWWLVHTIVGGWLVRQIHCLMINNDKKNRCKYFEGYIGSSLTSIKVTVQFAFTISIHWSSKIYTTQQIQSSYTQCWSK